MHFPEDIDSILHGPLSGWGIGLRMLVDAVSIITLARAIYYPLHRQKDYLFTFILFNALIFALCLLLTTASIQIGFAFGLFAIFSIIRYRTVTIPVKEMGYFFASVAMAMINALASDTYYYGILLASDVLILAIVLVLDRYVTPAHENVQEIIYERIELITPQQRPQLLRDLATRTGLPIHRVEISSIDFLHDIAVIRAYYHANEIAATIEKSSEEE